MSLLKDLATEYKRVMGNAPSPRPSGKPAITGSPFAPKPPKPPPTFPVPYAQRNKPRQAPNEKLIARIIAAGGKLPASEAKALREIEGKVKALTVEMALNDQSFVSETR